ncbi:hypothetical protein V6N13_121926 [Hibiscus sabdariffa]
MIGVNLGPKTWADVVAKSCLGCETLEEYQDQVEGSVSKGDMPDPSNNDMSLTYREPVHIASVLDLGDAADESGLTPSWAESIDKLNRTHNQSLDPDKTLITSDDSDKYGHSDCLLPEFSKKARQIKKKGFKKGLGFSSQIRYLI